MKYLITGETSIKDRIKVIYDFYDPKLGVGKITETDCVFWDIDSNKRNYPTSGIKEILLFFRISTKKTMVANLEIAVLNVLNIHPNIQIRLVGMFEDETDLKIRENIASVIKYCITNNYKYTHCRMEDEEIKKILTEL